MPDWAVQDGEAVLLIALMLAAGAGLAAGLIWALTRNEKPISDEDIDRLFPH